MLVLQRRLRFRRDISLPVDQKSKKTLEKLRATDNNTRKILNDLFSMAPGENSHFSHYSVINFPWMVFVELGGDRFLKGECTAYGMIDFANRYNLNLIHLEITQGNGEDFERG